MIDFETIAAVCASEGMTKSEIHEALKLAAGPNPIRELTEEQHTIYAGAAARAAAIMPPFRDAIALIRPFFDATTPTLYTDSTSRVGLGSAFFAPKRDPYGRATDILHEAMHVLMNHFVREATFKAQDERNISTDLEINTILEGVTSTNMRGFILPQNKPWGFPKMQTAEQYDEMIFARRKGGQKPQPAPGAGTPSDDASDGQGDGEGDQPGEGGSSGSSGSGAVDLEAAAAEAEAAAAANQGAPANAGCDASDDARQAAADKAGIQPASAAEQKVSRANTQIRLAEYVDKIRAAGKGSILGPIEAIIAGMQPPKADWRTLFRSIVARSSEAISRGKAEYTFRRVRRRNPNPEFIFPGTIDYHPRVMMAIDTSGSMSNEDYLLTLTEAEEILSGALRGKDNFSAFCIDTKATAPQAVSSIEEINLNGGGGTDMAMAITSVEAMPIRDQPDILIVSTDGGTDWNAVSKAYDSRRGRYKVIFLVTVEAAAKMAEKIVGDRILVIDVS